MTSARLSERSQPRGASRTPRPAGASRPGVRRQILEAALTEFAEKGFQEASLGAIARRLGVTAPLLLYHFGSKANLWREALEEFSANLAAVVDEAVREGRDLEGREALRLLLRRLVRFFAGNRAAYRLMRDEGASGSGQADQAEWFVLRNLGPIIEQIESVYRRAVDEGQLRPAPFETTFFMILGAASCYFESRILASRLFGQRPDEDEAWVDEYADQVARPCFEGLATRPRRSEGARPVLSAVRSTPRGSLSGNGGKSRAEAALG